MCPPQGWHRKCSKSLGGGGGKGGAPGRGSTTLGLEASRLNMALGNGRWEPCRFQGREQKAAVGGSEKH